MSNFNILPEFILEDMLFSKFSRKSSRKIFHDSYYKKMFFVENKRFFDKPNDLLQAIRCPLDHQMHQYYRFLTQILSPNQEN